jgi:hypothetical protein
LRLAGVVQFGVDVLKGGAQLPQVRRGGNAGLLGGVRRVACDYPGAAGDLQQALAIYRNIGDRDGHADVRIGVADALSVLGDLQLRPRAIDTCCRLISWLPLH